MVVPPARSQQIVDIILFGLIATILGTVGDQVAIHQIVAAELGVATASTAHPASAYEALPAMGLGLMQPHPPGGVLLACGVFLAIGLFASNYRTGEKPPAHESSSDTADAETTTDHNAHPTNDTN